MLTLVSAAACDDSVVEIGVIEDHAIDIGPEIEVPTSIRRGEMALLRVTTYGGGCVSIEDTELDITANGAEITPYDRRTPPKCLLILNHFKHDAHVSFSTLGAKTILVNGRSVAADKSEQVVQRTFTMTVVE
jgi:hypothetical protein